MKISELSTVQLLERWEDQREIKNLMGKYANCIILNREAEIFDLFWSKNQKDVCLGLNNGWYEGVSAICGYYNAIRDKNALVAKLVQQRFPQLLGGKSDAEIYGIGEFKSDPLYAPIIEVAIDGQTAKGLWYCMGTESNVGTAGPVAYWSWGYFAIDFILEDGDWKIWHMQNLWDLRAICGKDWGLPEEPYPDLPEFEPLRGWALPAPTTDQVLRETYSPTRPMSPAPPLPVAYETFAETFSYGC